MRPFVIRVRFLSPPLIGGAAATPVGLHANHAQLPDGTPYVPATALRGALRESLEAVLRGSGDHRACAGGDGVDPDAPSSTVHSACSLGEDHAPCVACRLFGTRRAKLSDAERAFSALVLGDAVPVPGAARWTARPSVAVTRARRSAADQQLVFRRVPESTDGDPLTFIAEGRLIEPALANYLDAAAQATTHVGSGRSRGLSRVELHVIWQDAARSTARSTVHAADLQIRVELASPALIGASVIDANYRETRHEIPGSTLRGAVGFALRELLADADHDPATQELLDAERGARFGFLYPAAPTPRSDIAGPLPITTAACKVSPTQHGMIDTLLDRLVLSHATSAAEAERATRHAVTVCHRCQQPLRTAHGSRRAVAPVQTRTVVRIAMDRTRQAARDEQLFSQVLLSPGVVMEGTIRGIPEGSRDRLAQALDSGILSFGRGRSAGWGRANIRLEPAPSLPVLGERAQAFDYALRRRLETAAVPATRVGRLVPVTLLSPLLPSEPTGPEHDHDGAQELCRAVGGARCFLVARRFARDGSWDQRTGEMIAFQTTAAGGVFVLELEGATWRDVVDRLEALERDGVGQRRHQGFGQVVCFDPHFLLSSQNG